VYDSRTRQHAHENHFNYFIVINECCYQGRIQGSGEWCSRTGQLRRRGRILGGIINILNEYLDFLRAKNIHITVPNIRMFNKYL
jgi:hypothetical protein